jgi:hypothetical protein
LPSRIKWHNIERMLTLSLREIRDRAQAFASAWAGETREHAEAKSFWDGFFNVFGRSRREVASFEDPVKKITGSGKNFIDLLWKGVLMAEHKSAGKDLGKAHSQAMSYIQDMINEGRRHEIPRYLIVSDFNRIALHDLDENTHLEIKLEDLPKNVEAFGFLAGIRQVQIKPQDPVNIEAAEKMAALHDALLDGGYPADQLDQLLTRVLFCLFAEDTQIFEANQFTSFILNHTRDDGGDLGVQLAQLFALLNTSDEKRQKSLAEHLLAFPYVNGSLFADQLPFAGTDRKMRETLLSATELDWSRISPAIFGSMFQGVMESKERRQVGAHYTGEPDILKVINPLFMDALRAEFAAILPLKDKKEKLRRLRAFHDKLASLNFFDPACGCGNFLIIAYRELRALETEVIKHELELTDNSGQTITDIEILTRVRVSQFHGIEIGHFPSEIARVAMWLMDHQANMHLSKELGRYFLRLPLTDSANIVTANALKIDWKTVISPEKCSFIFGNPPFIGYSYQTKTQKEELSVIVGKIPSGKVLDYVAAWHLKATAYALRTSIAIGFVSTNSICQGEQAGILWSEIFARGFQIDFAYQTFPWQSEARGRAAVHCVITGFSQNKPPKKRLFNNTSEISCDNINQYLVAAPSVILEKQSAPLFGQTQMVRGSGPVDGGHLLMNQSERDELVRSEPNAEKWIRPFLMGEEFINNIPRYCLWLVDCPPSELRQMPEVMKRVAKVKVMRETSTKVATQKLAATPTIFGEIRAPKSEKFLGIPQVSSERRNYVPVGYLDGKTVCGNMLFFVDDATLITFGIITSQIHMAWMRTTAGRLKSDFRYSNTLVYNNFPWPEPTAAQRAAVESAAQAILDAREQFPGSSLADLYDPLTMPPALAKAHAALDLAVDRCYRPQGFQSDRERVEHLFKLYEQIVAPLTAATKIKKPRKKTDKTSGDKKNPALLSQDGINT